MATSSENISNQQQLGHLLRNHRISQEWSLEDVSSQMRLDVLFFDIWKKEIWKPHQAGFS